MRINGMTDSTTNIPSILSSLEGKTWADYMMTQKQQQMIQSLNRLSKLSASSLSSSSSSASSSSEDTVTLSDPIVTPAAYATSSTSIDDKKKVSHNTPPQQQHYLNDYKTKEQQPQRESENMKLKTEG